MIDKAAIMAALAIKLPKATIVARGPLSNEDRDFALAAIKKINDRFNHAPALGNGAL